MLIHVNAVSPTPEAVSSLWTPGKSISNARELTQACSSAGAGKIACVYFVNGVLNDIETEVLVLSKKSGKPVSPPFCVPASSTINDQVAAITSTITSNPKMVNTPAAYAVRYVYSHNWPCKSAPAQ